MKREPAGGPVLQTGRGRRVAIGLIVVLLVSGGVRLLDEALHRPLLGYADNYDMLRLMAGYSLWPVDGLRGMNHPQAPWRRFAFADFTSENAIYSSQMLLQAPAIGAMRLIDQFRPGTIFDLRAIGFSQALLLISLAAAYCWRFASLGHTGAALLNGLVFAVLLPDPINGLYLNGFYCELGALFFLYWAVLAGMLVVVAGPTPWRSAVLGLSLLLLAVSKQQHLATVVLLAAGLLVATCIAARRVARGPTVALCLGTCVGAALTWSSIHRSDVPTQELRKCNLTNSILGGILPLAKDRARAVELLGMPPRCVAYVGFTWYDPRREHGHPCPEVFQVSRLSLVRLFWSDPFLPWRMLNTGLAKLAAEPAGLLVGLGHVEGGSHARVPRRGIADLVVRLHGAPRRIFWAFPLVLVGFYAIREVFRLRGKRPPDVGQVVVICGLLAYATLFLVVIGDGYEDYLRHNHLAVNLLLATYLLAGGHLVGSLPGTCRKPAAATAPAPPTKTGRLRGWRIAALWTALYLTLTALMVVRLRERPWTPAVDAAKVARQETDCGQLERAVRMPNGTVRVSGWVHPAPKQGAVERVILVYQGHVLPTPVFRGAPRDDISSRLGLPQLPGPGWEAAIPPRLVRHGGRLEAFLVFDDGTLESLPASPGVGLLGDGP